MGSSREDLREFPKEVRTEIGHALWLVEIGEKPASAKVLKGFGDASVLEIVEDDRSGTYRAVYTLRFAEVVYVLHAFQKKSRKGIKTPKQDLATIERRLKLAQADYESRRKG